jgi:hypothetical protein
VLRRKPAFGAAMPAKGPTNGARISSQRFGTVKAACHRPLRSPSRTAAQIGHISGGTIDCLRLSISSLAVLRDSSAIHRRPSAGR